MDLLDDGNLDNIECILRWNLLLLCYIFFISFYIEDDLNKIPSRKTTKLAIAVAVKVIVKANSKETIDFSLVWNMPNIFFSGNSKKIMKRFEICILSINY